MKLFLECQYPGEENPAGRFPHARSTFENLRMTKRAQLGYGLKVVLMAIRIPACFLKYFARHTLSVRRPLREFALGRLSGSAV